MLPGRAYCSKGINRSDHILANGDDVQPWSLCSGGVELSLGKCAYEFRLPENLPRYPYMRDAGTVGVS